MKVRIVKRVNENLLDEAKEDDLIAKYSIGKGSDKGNYDVHLFDFKKMLDWLHGSALKFAPGSTAKEMVANAKVLVEVEKFRADMMAMTVNNLYKGLERDLGQAIGA